MLSPRPFDLCTPEFVAPHMLATPISQPSGAQTRAATTPDSWVDDLTCAALRTCGVRAASTGASARLAPAAPPFALTLPTRTRAFWEARLVRCAPLLAAPEVRPHLSALLMHLAPALGAEVFRGLRAAATCQDSCHLGMLSDFAPEMVTWLLVGTLHKKAASQYTHLDAERVHALVHHGQAYVSCSAMPSERFAQYNALVQFPQAQWPAAIAMATLLRGRTTPTWRETAPTILDCIYQYDALSFAPGLVDAALALHLAPIEDIRQIEALLRRCELAQHQDKAACSSGEPERLHQALQAAHPLMRPQLSYRAWQQARLRGLRASMPA